MSLNILPSSKLIKKVTISESNYVFLAKKKTQTHYTNKGHGRPHAKHRSQQRKMCVLTFHSTYDSRSEAARWLHIHL